ncbi:DUF5689 domain-containing protein [Wenyingzhuangia aestuarii]|uniref:DUF5689 domain-containing protein n=1 Tax=Wenyingzhuangia aestuarii TaxID=1647582 RepID=UPI00143963C5|nr:DUF5689 domain-containing protein [Wenyingzhuangia aestuarii]NJB81604.1 hypothetical protein [Wenyingzhuangia aestuarii]
MKYSYFLILVFLVSCVDDFNHHAIDTTIQNPDISKKTEITFQQLFDLHSNEIGKDTIVTGYVVSSDQEGNFYKEIFVQNTSGVNDLGTNNPRMGLRVRVGVTTTSTKYAKGRKIVINLEGLKKTTSDDLLTLGKPSNTYIKDILEFNLDTHILKTEELVPIEPKVLEISDVALNDLNTLIRIEDLHFKAEEIGIPFAGLPTDDFDGKRTLEFCNTSRRDTLILETSNFSDFASELIPNKQVSVSGIYTINFDDEPVLVLNQFRDLEQIGTYANCAQIVTPNLMMTEVADPKVGSGEKARYVEIYNPTDNWVSLEGWKLIRYNKTSTNENAYTIPLDELTIAAKSTLIVATNSEDALTAKTWFQVYFNFAPALTNASIDGNGDDAYELIDPLNKVKDVYGEPNVDGTDLPWEYEDGVAVRKTTVTEPNTLFDVTEWEIKTKAPQLSTTSSNEDFTPGLR